MSSIPGEELAIARLSASPSGTPAPELPASRLSEAHNEYFNLSLMLVSPSSLCDQARIRAISSPSFASTWLRAIPSVSLGLTMSRQQFVCSLWYWLRISIFSSTDSVCCSCGSVVGQFGDHLLGYSHGPMMIHRHDALCDVIFMLSFKITVVVRGNSVVALIWIAQGMSFTLTICMVCLLTLMLLCVITYRILF